MRLSRHVIHVLAGVTGGIACAGLAVTAAVLIPTSGGDAAVSSAASPPPEPLARNRSPALGRAFVGYYPSWDDRRNPLDSVPRHYTHIMLSFARPDISWQGLAGNSWKGTGLNLQTPPSLIRSQIASLKAAGVKVVLSVGGGTPNSWDGLAAEAGRDGAPLKTAFANLLRELDIDGIDVDYEVHKDDAATVEEYARVIQALREAVDTARPDGVLTLAGAPGGADYTASTGDEGTGLRSNAGGATGRERTTFRHPVATGPHAGKKVGDLLDLVSVMAYDSGFEGFDPAVAYGSYRAIVPARTPVVIGMLSGKHGWGDAILVDRTADATCRGSVNMADQYRRPSGGANSVERLADMVLARTEHPKDGLMLWHVTKQSDVLCSGRPTSSPASIGEIVKAKFAIRIGG